MNVKEIRDKKDVVMAETPVEEAPKQEEVKKEDE